MVLLGKMKTTVTQKPCMNIHSSLFVIAPNWKQPRISSMVEWLNKLWYVHIINVHYSTINKQFINLQSLDESLGNVSWVEKKANSKRLKAVWFHLLYIWSDKTLEVEDRLMCVSGKGWSCKRISCVVRTIWYFDFGRWINLHIWQNSINWTYSCRRRWVQVKWEIRIWLVYCINVNILLVILPYIFCGCDHGGNWVKGSQDIIVLFLTIYNNLNKNFS